MASSFTSLLLLPLLLTLSTAAIFDIVNQCSYTVWAAALPGGGKRLNEGQSWTLNVSAGSTTTGRIWGRTGCSFNGSSHGSCQTGDCGGLLACKGYGSPPNTIVEYSLNTDQDYYDVSLVDGFNVPIDFTPTSGKCHDIGCAADVNGQCPTELRAPGGCNSPCTVFKLNKYCCTSGTVSCGATDYSKFFKNLCPDAYSYPTDDANSTFTCPTGGNYGVVFCPSRNQPPVLPTVLPTPPTQPTASPQEPTASPQEPDKSQMKSSNSTAVVIAAPLAGAFFLGTLLYLLWWCRRRNERRAALLNDLRPLSSTDLPLMDLAIIKAATNNFSNENKLGQGGFGPVYKGLLNGGQEIAVKRLSAVSKQGVTEFKNEVKLIEKLQHRNLVRMLGCCVEKEEKLLIYEYLPNKSLDTFIFDENKRASLDWSKRVHIIAGIARGVLYLHEDSLLKVIHRDLKSSNVLLDKKMNPKISDFGLAKIFGADETSEANTGRVVGTYGYMAPEYAMDGHFSVKSDVYSYGVLLLEIVSGEKNGRLYFEKHGQTLLRRAWQLWTKGKAMQLMDPLLGDAYPKKEALKHIHIGLLCVQESEHERPTMSSVVHMLRSEEAVIPQPTQPPTFTRHRDVGSNLSTSTGTHSNIAQPDNDVTISELSPR